MRSRLIAALVSFASAVCLAQAPPPGFVVFTGTRMVDLQANPVNGQICAQVVAAGGGAYSLQPSGGGTTVKPPVCTNITAGAFRTFLPITSQAHPTNACIAATAVDNVSGESLLDAGYSCLQTAADGTQAWCSNVAGVWTCNLDNYQPNLPALGVIQTGPQGLQGAPGCLVGATGCSTLAAVAVSGSASDIGTGVLSTSRLPAPVRNPFTGGSGPGVSADGNTVSDLGIGESWFGGLMHCPVGGLPAGWDLASNWYCQQGHGNAASSGAGYLVRELMYSGGVEASSGQFTMQAKMYWAGSQQTTSVMIMQNAPLGTGKTADSQIFGLGLYYTGLVLLNQGGATNLSSLSTLAPNHWYDFTLIYPGDGSVNWSASCIIGVCGVSGRVTGQALPANLTNFELLSYSPLDEFESVSYSMGSVRPVAYNIPRHPGLFNQGLILQLPQAGTIRAWVPQAYTRSGPNKWVLVFHGYGETGLAVQQEYAPVTNALYQQGYTIVSIDNTVQNCYGNPQCMADVQTAISTVRSALSLSNAAYVMADSMGGFEMFNAVARGTLQARAMVGFCVNSNLSWDYTTGGAASPINTAYSIAGGNPYGVATAGYDPLLASGAALDRLVAVPTLLYASPGDTTVAKGVNTDAYASMVNGAGGNVTVVTTTGNHLDASNFNAAQTAAFLQAN